MPDFEEVDFSREKKIEKGLEKSNRHPVLRTFFLLIRVVYNFSLTTQARLAWNTDAHVCL